MTSYRCPRCGYNTPHRQSLLQHLRRKKPCLLPGASLSDNERLDIDAQTQRIYHDLEKLKGSKSRTRVDGTAFVCNTCGQRFNFRASLSRHCKSCASSSSALVTEQKQRQQRNADDDARIQDLQRGYVLLKNEIEDLRRRPVCTTNNYNNGHSTINNNVQINALGHEDLTHITPQLVDTCIRRTTKGLVELMEKIHFDSGTCNHNVRASLTHPEQVEYHDGDSWKFAPRNRIVRQVVDSSHHIMSNRYDDNQQELRSSMSHAMYEFVDRWMNKMTKTNAQVYVDVMSEAYCAILNRSREL